MGKRPLNLPFLGLQALLILIDCIAVAYVSPILVSFGYSPMRIGRVMTLAALGGHPCPTGMGLSQRPFCVCPAGYVAGHRRRDQLLLSAGFWG